MTAPTIEQTQLQEKSALRPDTNFSESLEEYFKKHPDEENEFVEEMARLYYLNDPIDYPEDWNVNS